MITLLLGLALGVQDVPGSASVLYPAFPECPQNTPVKVVTHAATYTLEKKDVSFDSQTVFRNMSDKPVTFKLVLPVRGKNANWDQVEHFKISAIFNKSAVSLNHDNSNATIPPANRQASGIAAETYGKLFWTTVTFKAQETKSLDVHFTSPIGRAGLDAAQRMVVYDTAGASYWDGPVGQLNYTIKYKPKLVLQVYAKLPENAGWQVGNAGAFLKFMDYKAPEKPLLIFTYYPGGFDKIGGG